MVSNLVTVDSFREDSQPSEHSQDNEGKAWPPCLGLDSPKGTVQLKALQILAYLSSARTSISAYPISFLGNVSLTHCGCVGSESHPLDCYRDRISGGS